MTPAGGNAGPAAAFREVMAAVCTPVSVVTAAADGRPHGTTVSAFASLSLNPPMVLVSLDRTSQLLGVVRRSGRFGINVLGSDQSGIARVFAGKGGAAKFDGVPWEFADGVPRIPGAGGFLACRVARLVEGGDHIVVLGEVHAAHTVEARPLTYHGRVFGTHIPLTP
jgi:flavin reductase (DIM6/NTAB) family NADH-FMN oxidoreductase RutF